MKEQNIQQQMLDDDNIDLKELFTAIWQGKWIIIAFTFISAIIAVVYALSLPNIYKSEVLLAPAEENQGGGAGLASQFGGLAAIAGVNLGGSGMDKTTLALEVLKSRAFIAEFINEHDLKATLMATNGWDIISNTLKYNEDIYNADTKTWLRVVNMPKKPEPSDLEVHEYFIKESLSITTDKETGLVLISIKHYSPYIAKEIVDKLVVAINDKIKKGDIAEANKSIKYLRSALNETPIADMQKVFYQLIEQQEQTKMLASVREQYVLKTIDPSVVSEKRNSPNRVLICILGVMIGGILSVLSILVRYFYKLNY
jgi:uncharacterized protein involved in exopolysaccharide biosynthesis